MTLNQTRRRFLTTLSMAGAAGLLRPPRALAAEGALETTTVRLQTPGLCVAPVYLAEALLRAEGFTDIRYDDASDIGAIAPVAHGEVDFASIYASQSVRAIDAGERVTLLAGVMVGCFELFAREGIAAGDLDGGPGRARSCERHPLDHRPRGQADRIVRPEKNRRVSGFSACAPGSAGPAYRPRDRQHRRGPPMVAILLLHDRRQP